MRQALRIVAFFALLLALNAVGAYVRAAQSPPAPSAEPFSELETARLDALAQEGRALDAEQRLLTVMREKWTAKVGAFKSAAESKRPGWTWDADSGKWSKQ